MADYLLTRVDLIKLCSSKIAPGGFRVPNSPTGQVLNRRPTSKSRMEEETRLDRNIWSGQVQSSRGPV